MPPEYPNLLVILTPFLKNAWVDCTLPTVTASPEHWGDTLRSLLADPKYATVDRFLFTNRFIRQEECNALTADTAPGLILGSRHINGIGISLLRMLMGFVFHKQITDPAPEVLLIDRSSAKSIADSAVSDSSVGLLCAALEQKIPIRDCSLSESGSLSFGMWLRTVLTVFLTSSSLKYLFSSVAAFAVDYLLLLLLNALIPSPAAMEISAALAWIVSSLTNFTLNRTFVFRSRAPLLPSLLAYYSLAGVVFLLKTYVLLELLTRAAHLPLWAAKPICEVLFYIGNYFIQKKLIFRKQTKQD